MADDTGERERNQAAVEGLASDIAKNANGAIAAALTGGRSAGVTSELAHQVAAAVARAQDSGQRITLGAILREAQRRR